MSGHEGVLQRVQRVVELHQAQQRAVPQLLGPGLADLAEDAVYLHVETVRDGHLGSMLCCVNLGPWLS